MFIFLIGYMGAGKTSIGKKLSNKINYTFIDLDAYIEDRTQKSISDIFSEKGESYFRELERKCFQEIVSAQKNTVISTGGGFPCYNDNMESMNSQGTTIYIKLSPKSLYTRLKDSRSKRPIIANKTDDELLQFIEMHLNERDDFYTRANIIVKGEGLTHLKLHELLVAENYLLA